MKRKIFIYCVRTFASLFLLTSFLLMIAVIPSDKGDILDRNAGWILLAFFLSLAIFIYSALISEVFPTHIYRKKTVDEQMNEIKKSNLNRLKEKKNADQAEGE